MMDRLELGLLLIRLLAWACVLGVVLGALISFLIAPSENWGALAVIVLYGLMGFILWLLSGSPLSRD